MTKLLKKEIQSDNFIVLKLISQLKYCCAKDSKQAMMRTWENRRYRKDSVKADEGENISDNLRLD